MEMYPYTLKEYELIDFSVTERVQTARGAYYGFGPSFPENIPMCTGVIKI